MGLYIRHLAKRVIDLHDIGIEMGVLFNPVGNFSLLPMGDKWLAVFRRFQYYIEGDRYSYLSSPQMLYKDRNHHLFALLDKDFKLVRVIDNPVSTYYETKEWETQFIYGGEDPFLEDARFTKCGDDTFLTSAIYYYENGVKKWATEVQSLDIHPDYIDAHHFWNSLEHGVRSIEKNWISIPGDRLRFVTGTSTNGARTRELKYNTGCEICDYDPDDLYGGSTNLLKDDFQKCYYAITHKYFHGERGRRTYENYIVKYNEDFRPVEFSEPFKFCEQGIEFITTMLELPNNELLVGITEMDDKPQILVYDKDELMQGVSKRM